MRWKGQRESENVEDRRRLSAGPVLVGGGIGTLLLLLVAVLFGADPRQLMNQVQQQAPAQGGPRGAGKDAPPLSPEEEEQRKFVSVVLADTEDVWTKLFQEMGKTYQKPKLVLFSGKVQSACGFANAAVGPFYCPADQNVYIDLTFYDELQDKFKAPGDFAQAYVVAHEIGHHVQNQLGLSEKVRRMQQQVSKAEGNDLSVRLELQADFLAGVWAHHAARARGLLEEGDLEEGLQAATAIGDDRLQMQSQGYVVPDSFTHGSSEQRVRWFRRGLQSGKIQDGDTFSARDL